MSVIVTDSGFGKDDVTGPFLAPQDLEQTPAPLQVALQLGTDADPEPLLAHFGRITLIRIDFASFSDGRGFTLAQRLRRLGYVGRLRAKGHVLADQFTMARRCGFDEVEISAELALRQPQEHWKFRGNWRHHDYRSRMQA